MTQPPETESPSFVGTLIEGKYLLERELGAGGMGAVYLARHKTIEREVAIKLLHRSLASDASIRRRFETEARAIARLSHPNCVMLYEFGLEPELEALYAVFEYVKGRSLEKWAGQRLAIDDVLDVGRQVVAAIEHAHSQKIIHRDLKPDNIMVTVSDSGKLEVKVLDFGIARIAEDDETQDQSRLTKMGQMFGTPPYMSPEQIRARLNITFATDIYSIGVILYELIEGRLPFLADSPIETVMLHLNEEVPPMVRSDLPEELRAIVMRCLQKDPEDRFGSCTELRQALDRVVVEAGDVTALTDVSAVADLRGRAAERVGELGAEPTQPQAPDSDPMVHAHSTELAFGNAPTLGASPDSWQGGGAEEFESPVGVGVMAGRAGGSQAATPEPGLAREEASAPALAVGAEAASAAAAGPGPEEASGEGVQPAASQKPGRPYQATEDVGAARQAPETWPEVATGTQRRTLVMLMVGIGVAVLVLAGVVLGKGSENPERSEAAALEERDEAGAGEGAGLDDNRGSEAEEGAQVQAAQGDGAPAPIVAAGGSGEVDAGSGASGEGAPEVEKGARARGESERDVAAGEEVRGAAEIARPAPEVAPSPASVQKKSARTPAPSPAVEEPEEPVRLRLDRKIKRRSTTSEPELADEPETTEEPTRLRLPGR